METAEMGFDFLRMKSKLEDFKALGYKELYSLEDALLFIRLLDAEQLWFTLKHDCCPLGEYWYFKKI